MKNKKGQAEIVWGLLIALTILLLIGGMLYAYYANNKIKHQTYLDVIDDLDDVNKCLYQCGFIYPSQAVYDNYKFCAEKCDRINERSNEICPSDGVQ